VHLQWCSKRAMQAVTQSELGNLCAVGCEVAVMRHHSTAAYCRSCAHSLAWLVSCSSLASTLHVSCNQAPHNCLLNYLLFHLNLHSPPPHPQDPKQQPDFYVLSENSRTVFPPAPAHQPAC
jgi:hypothetical protein